MKKIEGGNKMKIAMKLLLIASLVTSVCAGCGSNRTQATSAVAETVNTSKQSEDLKAEAIKKVGIVQPVDHASLDTIRECAIEGLKEAGYVEGENLEIYYENALGDTSNLNSICNQFVADDVDVIVAIATPAAQAAAAATSDIPIVFDAVADPIGAKLVEDLDAPSGNITGTSHMIPVDKVFEFCKELTPEVKTIGFLYTSSEVSSQSTIEKAKEAAPKYDYSYIESTITSVSELQQAAEILADQVDAIYVPNDNTIASAMTVLGEVGREKKIPIYVGADSMVQDGGYANVGVSFEELGIESGKMIGEILDGKKPSDIPVKRFDDFQKIINKTTAEKIGAPYEVEGAIIVE